MISLVVWSAGFSARLQSKSSEDAAHDLTFASKSVARRLLVRSAGVEVATQGFADDV